jgi:tetratricopeptide (TPR) repeat protein
LIAGLATLDKFLAKAQDQELQDTAQSAYHEGLKLRSSGKMDAAIDSLRKAYSLERQNRDFTLALADTLVNDNKLDEADRLLHEVLERNSNDAQANLLSAHMMARRNQPAEAESFFHRAIYGEWQTDVADKRVAARLELIDFLAAIPERKKLLAELLALPEDMKKTPALEQHLGELFLTAGSPSRAIDEYKKVLSQAPTNAAAHIGMGNAELELGNYSKARDAFLNVSKTNPADAETKNKLDLTMTLAALDPTSRHLTSIEKYRRSLNILGLTRISLGNCLANHTTPDDEAVRLEAAADQQLAANAHPRIANETAEDMLALAEKVWQARINGCGEATSPPEEPLRLIMGRLSR